MPTSIGDPAAGQRLNIPSLPKDAEIRINDGQYESRANPRPQSLGIIEIRFMRDLERSATRLADEGERWHRRSTEHQWKCFRLAGADRLTP